ncbi:hypothetical protein [Streptomyces sp. NBC_01803]|uniref:hypothetical protein n=1 Tax=Streptomyces sp. NBC_01803 TaxID=2975946 RepID=UPI002DD9BEC6|nr:hypothetical protein [Streptomyces sp. NBC_01803]WSA46191.1 hypothetical protein OIE51_19555 [Streptomyces sp. NBC_01803]
MRVGITGHRGLPENVAVRVRELLRSQLVTYAPDQLIGVSCIADGPDAWFADIVLDLGGRIEVVVPAVKYRDDLPEWHHPAYDELLRRATQMHDTGLEESDSQAHMAGSEILVGLSDALLAVWDGKPARGHGGTADVVAYAQANGVPVHVLWPDGATRD